MPTLSETRLEAHFGSRVFRCFVERGTNVYAELKGAAALAPAATAIVQDDLRLGYGPLLDEIGRVAKGLARAGIKRGDRVATLVGNEAGFAVVAFAVWRLAAILVPIDIRLARPEIVYVANNCTVSALIVDRGLQDRLPSSADLPAGCRLFVLPRLGGGERLFPEIEAGGSPNGHHIDEYRTAGEDDVALILHTSGTTGHPKGVMLAHINIIHSVRHFALTTGVNSSDRIAVVTPITHVTGLIMGLVSALLLGATAVLLREFKARLFLEMAAAERITQTVMVPAMYQLCLLDSEFDRFDLSHWRIGNYGGSPMPEATTRAMAEKLPRLQLINGYGSSETCSPAAMVVPGGELIHGDCVGVPVTCADVVIVDDAGREVPAGHAGEIWVAGPMVSQGYWSDPEATAAGFTGGYWHSGDVGRIDERGYLHLLDRIKDMVNRGGYKVYSAEVENVIALMRGVVEVAVVGRPSQVLGERVHAFVAVADATITAETVKAFCVARLADFKVPESFTISHERLPRGSGGKVLKKILRDRAMELGEI